MGNLKEQSSHASRRGWRVAVVGALAAGSIAGFATGGAQAGVSPETNTLQIPAGGTGTETKTVDVPEVPAKADIEIAIDTTGSMGAAISQAKTQASELVAAVQAAIPDAHFAVVDFRDSFDAEEYVVRQPMTADAAAVQTGIDAMFASGGGDFPEAYNLVFNRAHQPAVGGDIGWRDGSRKFVVVIGDAPPHGAMDTYPSCPDGSADPHGLDTATELGMLAAAQRTLFLVATNSFIRPCYDQLAAGGFSGSRAANLGDDIATQMVGLIEEASATVEDVHLEVASATPAPASASWISFDPPSHGPVETPATLTFTVTAAVPAGTPGGTYTFVIVALADGGDIGRQTLSIVVPSGDTGGCAEDGLQVLDGTGIASGTVHDQVEPLVGSLLAELEPPVHQLNCDLVVPVEDLVDSLLVPVLG